MLTTEETPVAAVVAAPRVRPSHNFKWDEESDLLFLKAVFANKAYIRTAETLEVKWVRVFSDLTNRVKFMNQGFTGKSGALTVKLKTMFATFKETHGGRNLSALPCRDDMSDVNELLLLMVEGIEKLGEEVELEKNTKKQKKRFVKDITDTICKGGVNVKQNLYSLASDLRSSDEVMLSASVSNFAKMGAPAAAVTPSLTERVGSSQPPKRRRPAEPVESDDAALMAMFSTQIKKDKESAEVRFVVLEKQIKESGQETTSAIHSTNAALIAAISRLSTSILNR